MSLRLRDVRLDLSDMQMLTEFIEFDLPEYIPRRSPEHRLAQRVEWSERFEAASLGSVVELDGDAVGISTMIPRGFEEQPEAMAIWIGVHPSCRRQGIGKRIFAEDLESARGSPFSRFVCSMNEDAAEAVAFVGELGFRQADRMFALRFDVRRRESADGIAVLDAAAKSGIEILSLHAFQARTDEWSSQLFELTRAFATDIPARFGSDMAGTTGRNAEEFLKLLLEKHCVDMRGSFVAIVDGVLAATSWLSRTAPELCDQPLTGVRPDFRRRGLVKVLKQACFGWASDQGVRHINTMQHESNVQMLALNKQLGFEVVSSQLIMCYDFP
jgi:GNAT superfamily N-acetyltransferase